MSGEFPLQFPLISPEDVSSSENSTSSSGEDNKMQVGKVTDNKIETPFVAKDAKDKVVEDRIIVVAAHNAKTVGEIKERSISSAKAKAAKAGSKVDKLHTKLAEATKVITAPTPPGRGTAPTVFISHHSQSHKKSEGIPGFPSSVQPSAVCPQLSPQQKTGTPNERVSIQSHLWFPLRSPEDLSSSESSTSSSGDDYKMLVGGGHQQKD